MNIEQVYDVIVVGAGVEGSATAYYLTSRYTKNVLLLEQFGVAHSRGSSHGGSRVTRRSYHESFYTRMMDSAYKMWSEIEAESGKKLYIKTGMLVFGDEAIRSYSTSLKKNNIDHRVTRGSEANSTYPRQLCLPDDYICVMDEDAGILRASTAVSALQSLFVANGGHLLDHQRVNKILPGSTIVTIETNAGSFRCKKVILTAGAWTNKLLEPIDLKLPLNVIKTDVFYWRLEDESAFTPDAFPVFYSDKQDGKAVYGIPAYEYHGLIKICYHDGVSVDPDNRDAFPGSTQASSSIVSEFIARHLKGVVSSQPAIVEPCMYTMTPTRNPFIDVHPKYANIIIGAGFSGHGFKLAPVVGQILSELALDKTLSYDLSFFKIVNS